MLTSKHIKNAHFWNQRAIFQQNHNFQSSRPMCRKQT
jgi:hypothetical protein